MAKLEGKVQARKFKPGDIVIPHPKRRDLITVGQGIVLLEIPLPSSAGATAYIEGQQNLLVYFAASDTDLHTEARKFARTWFNDPSYQPNGMQIKNIDLQIVRSETGWLDAPSIEEVQMQRFADVGKEL